MGHTEHEKLWPSVTQVLSVVDKPFLRIWYGKLGTAECERIKKEAGEFGQQVHDGIAELLGGREPSCDGSARRLINTFRQWQQQSNFTPIEIERKVESKQYEYHGTLDSIGHFGDPNSLFVLDWKTSSKIDELYGAQLAAYGQAYFEETGTKIKTGGVVRLEKKEDKPKLIEVKTFQDLDSYFDVFLACLEIHKFLHPTERRRRK